MRATINGICLNELPHAPLDNDCPCAHCDVHIVCLAFVAQTLLADSLSHEAQRSLTRYRGIYRTFHLYRVFHVSGDSII